MTDGNTWVGSRLPVAGRLGRDRVLSDQIPVGRKNSVREHEEVDFSEKQGDQGRAASVACGSGRSPYPGAPGPWYAVRCSPSAF
jgi:hypothetical protein